MGKKKDKAAKKVQEASRPVPLGPNEWRQVDANPLKVLTGKDIADFSEWESKPALFKADDFRKRLLTGLMDMDSFEKVLESEVAEELTFGMDIRAAKTVDGKRVPGPEDGETEVSEVLDLYHSEGYTLQFLQPQRFEDRLWRLVAALEAQLGCLVGCNAYLTPKDTQGLAPHHDDVELWVCQTQGSKRWRLYAPKDGHHLPSASSEDFLEADIGEPVMDVVLEVGDVLYLPRGTIHQAVASEGHASAHLTISTYQHWTWAMLTATLIQQGAEERDTTAKLPLEMRKGLPLQLVFDTALENTLNNKTAAAKAAKGVASSVAQALRALAEQVESKPEIIYPATLSIAEGFMRDRLPPHPEQVKPDVEGSVPSIDGRLYCRGRCWFMTKKVVREDENGEEKQLMKLCSCLTNDRRSHMMAVVEDSEEEGDPFGDGEGLICAGSDDEDEEHAPELVEAEIEEAAKSVIEKMTEAGKDKTAGNGMPAGKSEDGKAKRKRDKEEEHENDYEGAKLKKKKCASTENGNGAEAEAGVNSKKEGVQQEGGEDGKAGNSKKALVAGVEQQEEEHDDGSEGGQVEDSNDEEDEDQEDQNEDDDGLSGLLFPVELAEAVALVLCTSGKVGVAVKDLPLEHQKDKMELAVAMWAEGIVSTKPVQYSM